MLRVLQELSELDGGGVAKLVYDYCTNIDKSKIQFDFIIFDYNNVGIYEQPIKDMGCKLYKIPRFKNDKKTFLKEMEKIVKNGNYDIVYSHLGSRGLPLMYFGKKYKIKRRIAHSHIAFETVTKFKALYNKALSVAAKLYATELIACGKDAGVYMWGKKAKPYIMANAIDTKLFKFSPEIRLKKRTELDIDDKFVIGIVGRLAHQKNYPYLLKVYKEVLRERDDTVLLIIGRGPDEDELKQSAKDLGIDKDVIFLGVRDDVQDLLNAFDIFVLPSHYEGLPVALIEAQASGLIQLVSDKVTDEMHVTDLLQFLPIQDENIAQWKDAIVNCKNNVSERDKYWEVVKENGYDIIIESKRMENYFLKK